jgi:putative ABC transport system permease protein
MTTGLPGTGFVTPSEWKIVGRQSTFESQRIFAPGWAVSADYFRTLGIALVGGETCRMDPSPNQPGEILVNRRFAESYFPGENPLGQSIAPEQFGGAGGAVRITGIVADVRDGVPGSPPQPAVYRCGTLFFWPDPVYVVKTSLGTPAAMTNAVREAVHRLDASRAVYEVTPLTDVLSEELAPARFNTLLLTLFAATALLLASVGLYGVMSYFVARRKREIGIRMAIGAQPAQIQRGVIKQAAILTVAGIVAGLAGAAALTRFLSTMLYGVGAHDVMAFAAAPLLLALVAAVASALPTRRASRVNPMVALRDE